MPTMPPPEAPSRQSAVAAAANLITLDADVMAAAAARARAIWEKAIKDYRESSPEWPSLVRRLREARQELADQEQVVSTKEAAFKAALTAEAGDLEGADRQLQNAKARHALIEQRVKAIIPLEEAARDRHHQGEIAAERAATKRARTCRGGWTLWQAKFGPSC